MHIRIHVPIQGRGVKRNHEEACRLFRLAAAGDTNQAGTVEAMTNLATAYRAGRGVPQDFSEAKRLYERAVGLGDWVCVRKLYECRGFVLLGFCSLYTYNYAPCINLYYALCWGLGG